MIQNLILSPATSTDVAGITQLVNSAYRSEGEGWTNEAAFIAGERITENGVFDLLQQPGKTLFKCSNAAGALLGCVLLELQDGYVYLGLLSVQPALQAAGIGRFMLDFGVQYAQSHQCSRIVITVVNKRTELINWYERRGYVRTGKTIALPPGIGMPVGGLHFVEMEKEVPAL
ncbi:GNAT family N-acetyltransferase [Deminuibacter soli]|uniref:GNAT family N-acetyltransferase n=1 Tax=Deminuibacter soli TaxID=2291815 RepID=A0A3E1NQJ6_9BACT|nr:GNAT family N-acetyltransferase [Deminuibacter soli]RFM30094.1 GNAT family N-acetyltransferase [Deminuibacter soli]